MPTFTYKARTSPQTVHSGSIDAPDRTQATQRLQAMGYRLLALQESSGQEGLSLRRFQRVRTADLALFWRQLASLLEAGMPLVRALQTAQEQADNKKLAELIGRVRDSVENAASFSQSLGRFGRTFSPVIVSIVASGEATGTLPQVVAQLADKVEKEQDLRGKVRSAMIYPVFLLLVGFTVIGVLVTFVIPRFRVLFSGMGRELPAATRALLAVSEFARDYWWIVLVVVAGSVGIFRQLTRKGRGRAALDRFKLHLPVIGKMIQKIEMARFAHTFGSLCANGVHILPAMEITARTMGNQVIAQEILAARDRIAKGSRVEAALRKGRYFPPALVNMVAVGEDSAALDKMLEKVASVFERDSDRVVSSATKLMESVLILILGTLVAIIVASILLPIFQATSFVE